MSSVIHASASGCGPTAEVTEVIVNGVRFVRAEPEPAKAKTAAEQFADSVVSVHEATSIIRLHRYPNEIVRSFPIRHACHETVNTQGAAETLRDMLADWFEQQRADAAKAEREAVTTLIYEEMEGALRPTTAEALRSVIRAIEARNHAR